jgi:hypothetical protein
MEHVPYEKQFTFLDSALSMLKEDGMIFITTPDEEIVEPPHIGIWSSSWFPKVREHLSGRILKSGHFDNKSPRGFSGKKSSHHALVLR